MDRAIDRFNFNVKSTKDLIATIDHFDQRTTGILDFGDLYRAQLVLIVSALDHFIHEFVLEAMVSIYAGRRPATDAFRKFQIPIVAVLNEHPSEEVIRSYIRLKHSSFSFQMPERISDAIKLISHKKVWEEIAPAFGLTICDLKSKLKLIVDRRNKIAHESDMDPSFPGRKWPISPDDVIETAEFIRKLGNEIFLKIA